jgi:hypothetical protein
MAGWPDARERNAVEWFASGQTSNASRRRVEQGWWAGSASARRHGTCRERQRTTQGYLKTAGGKIKTSAAALSDPQASQYGGGGIF